MKLKNIYLVAILAISTLLISEKVYHFYFDITDYLFSSFNRNDAEILFFATLSYMFVHIILIYFFEKFIRKNVNRTSRLFKVAISLLLVFLAFSISHTLFFAIKFNLTALTPSNINSLIYFVLSCFLLDFLTFIVLLTSCIIVNKMKESNDSE